MAKKFSEPSEGASVSRVNPDKTGVASKSGGTGKSGGDPMVAAASDVKDGRYKKAAGETTGALVGAYVGGDAGAKVGAEVGSRVGDMADKKDKEKKEKKEQKQAERRKEMGLDNNPNDSDKKSDEDEKKKKDKKNSPIKNARKAMMAAQAVDTGMKMAAMAKLLMMLKMMLQMAIALAQAAISTIAGAIMAVAHAIVAGVMAVVNTIGAVATAIASGVIAATVAIAVAVGVASVRDGDIASRDDMHIDCNDDSSFMYSAMDATGDTLTNAKKVYAFFKAYGLADTNIAGILGNWSHESGIDPTGVETIFTEKFIAPVPGTKKWEIWHGPCRDIIGISDGRYIYSDDEEIDFRLATVNDYGYASGLVTYTGDILRKSVYTSYHSNYPNIHYLGIGLGQWTNGRNLKLRAYADMFEDLEWYDLDLQLMFCIDKENGDEPYYVNKLASWHDEPTATAAAKIFCTSWEGIGYSNIRGESAERWLTTIGSWVEGVDYDLSEAESLLAAANASGSRGADYAGSRKLRSCSGLTNADNSSAAKAILSYAWGPGDNYENDGNDCWRHLFEAIVHDSWYRCCDRTVCVAIRWSGTDSDYPVGGTSVQLEYLMTSPRWQKVDWGGDKTQLMPGDVLIRNDDVSDERPSGVGKKVHHTLMYVGNDLVRARFGEEWNGTPSTGFEVVSGSKGEYSPHVGYWSTSGTGSGNYPSYYVYRNVEKFSNRSEWTDLTCVD